MKKLLTLLLSFLLLLSLTACDMISSGGDDGQFGSNNPASQEKEKEKEDDKEKEDNDNGESSDIPGLTQEDIDEANDALDQLMEMFYTEEWRWESDGDGYINGKWDHMVMYDPVPQPSGNFVTEEMQFSSKQGSKWNDYCSTGEMYIEATDYEYITVFWESPKEDLDALLQAFADGGWVIEDDSSEWVGLEYHMYYGGEYYTYLKGNNWGGDDENIYSGTLYVFPYYYERPEKVQDLPFPEFGFWHGGGYYNAYNENYDWNDTEYPLDTPVRELDAYWCMSTELCGCTTEDVQSYLKSLTDAGWSEIYNDDSEEWYYIRVEKDGRIMQISLEKGCNLVTLQLANDEQLFY